MAMNTDQITVTDAAGLIVASNANRKQLIMKNIGNVPIYIADDNSVTAANGLPILGGKTFNQNDFTGDVYGICDTGESADMEFLEQDMS